VLSQLSSRARKRQSLGDALALLITSARSPYHFSLHASDPKDPDGGSRKDTGHTFICGPTAPANPSSSIHAEMLSRQGVTQVVFDKDRGLEILIRALGGTYLPLKNGVSTGFNPLQLPPTPANVEFLKTWLRSLVRGPTPLSIAKRAIWIMLFRGARARAAGPQALAAHRVHRCHST